jgi:transposase-like protein
MSYTSDWKPTKAENPTFVCIRCKSDEVEYREWESSDGAHDDTHYRCRLCEKEWWVEGSDA